MTMHADQLVTSAEQVGRLVADQFPAWAGLAVAPVASPGTVNALFRLGDALVARFPLLPGDPDAVRQQLEGEAARAAELHTGTSVPTPEPVAIGHPGHGYPLPWAVQTWLPGDDAFTEDPSGSVAFAHDLAGFIAGLRGLDTRGRRFAGGGRGGELATHDDWVELCLERSGDLFDVPLLREWWAQWRVLPRKDPDAMSHTDLIPGNLLVRDGRLAGVLDAGGFGPADPALDAAAAWQVLEAGPRDAFRNDLGCDELEWERGRAWAFVQAIGAGWYYRSSNPAMHRLAVRTIERLSAVLGADPPAGSNSGG
jgi:aminoglycoside phosphotransferase (APT) family kinase protein